MLTIAAFIAVLSLLVFAHELGHFVVAKRAGVKVLEFGFGYPPRLFKIGNIGGTDYTINALPIGGFVRMEGEEDPSSPSSLASKSRWVRAGVLIAGAGMNLLLAMLIYVGIYMAGVELEVGNVRVVEVASGSPAAQAGLQSGDVIASVNGQGIDHSGDLQVLILQNAGQQVTLAFRRDGEMRATEIVPREQPPEGEGALGVVIETEVTGTEVLRYPIWEAIPAGITRAFEVLGLMVLALVAMIRGLIAPQIAGPIGIAQATGEFARAGPIALADFTAILSLNLFILNLLPLPALDGGRLMFVIVEAIRGKRIDPKKEALVHFVGMAALLIMLLIVSYFDVLRLFSGEPLL